MREILFRGYNRRIEKWIYGCLVKCWSKVKEDFIDDKPMIFSRNNNNHYEIDKYSIGQYTGFNYQNGQKIYEGDYVEDKDLNISGFVRFSAGRWCVEDVCEPLEEKELCAINDLIDFKSTEYELQMILENKL